ncbi:ParB N-terminal domain-containing protein [Riemerella anatipestifer]|nr:ParB N-terminal domain-containing protein [Riemerella anatipestifer]
MDIKDLYEEFKNNGGTLSMEDFAVMHSSLDPSEDTPIDDVKKKEYPTLQNTEGIVPKSVLEELQGHPVNQIPETEPTPINQTLDFLALATTGVSPSMALESETGVSSSTENYKTTTPFSENLPIEPSNNIEGNISTPITVDSINEDIIHPNIDSINRIKNTLNKVSTQIPNISNSSISESISQTENIDFDKVAEVLPSAYTNPIVEHGNIISEFVPKDYKGKFEIPTLYKELTVISNNQEEALTNLEANEKNGVLKITRGNDGKPIKNSEGQYMFTITDQDYLNNEFIPYVKKLNEQIGEDNTEIAREGLGKAIHDFEEGIKPPASPLQDFYRDYFEITGKPFDQSDIGRISTKQDRDNYLLEAEAMVEAEKTGNDYQSIYQQKIENRNKEWANDTQKAISFVNEMLKGVDVSATQKNGNTDYTINGYRKEKEVIQDILKNETLKNYFISFWKEYGDNYYGGGVMRQRNILYQQKGRAEVLDAFDEYIMNRYSSDYEANKEIVNHYSIKTKEAISKKDKNSLVSALGNIENSYQNINNSQQSFNDIERFQLKRLAAQKEVYKEKIEQGQAEADHDNRLLGTLKSYPLAVINRAIDAGKGLVLGIPHFVNEVLVKSDDARYLLEKASAPTKIGNVITGGVFDRVNEYEIDNKTIIEKNGMYFEKSDNGNKPIVLTTAQKSKLNLKNSYRDFSVKGLFGTVAEQGITMLGAEFAGAKALGLTSKVLSRGIASASKVYGSESAFVNMLRNGLRFSKNPTNNGIIGWTNATLLDNGDEAKALGLSGTEYAVSTLVKSMTTGLMSKVNPDVTFFKSAKTLEEGLIQALRDGNSGAIKGLINNFTSGVTKSMLKEVPGELLQEYLEIPAATLAELTTTAITQKNTITPYTVDQIIDTGIETAATVASLGLISHTRGVGKSFEKDGLFINVGKLSDRERISLLANIYDENTFKNFKHDFGVKQEVIDRIENKVTTVKKYIDQIPNKENYSLSDMFTIGVKLQEVEHLEQKRDNAKEVFKNIYDADIKAAQKVISDIVYNKNNVIETEKNNQSSSETITSNEPEIETQKVNESSESSRIDSSKDNMMKKDEAITIDNTPNTSVNNDVPYSTTTTEKTEDNGKLNSEINEDEVLDSILNNPTFSIDNDNATEQELENASDTSPTITNDKLDTKLNSNPTDTQIEIKPLSEISTDENRFQARKKLNETVINNIANNYSEKDQDPIHVWQDPKDGKTYVLSGHHRYYGAKQAGRNDVKIIDRTKDFTEEEAIRFAKEEANANRSMETPLERAATLRQKRERNDAQEDINNFLNREGKNKRLVHNLSYLNPKGKAVQSVASFENSSNSDSKRETEKIADWIGEARRIFGNKLTDAHENEMFDFLNDKEASKRFSKKGDFVEKVRHIVGGMYYDSNAPLNLKRIENKGNAEMEYENEMRELKNKAAEYDAQISNIDDRFTNAKREDYISPDAKDFKEVKEIARKEKERLKNEQKAIYSKIDKLQREKGKYIKADIAQPTLFQKGNVNTKTISKKAFDELIERLKKPFAKAFKNLNVTTDWETFKNRLNALGNVGNLEDLAFFQNLSRVNEKFNKELDQLIKGTLPKGHIFQLGKPSPILKSSGIPDLPIELNADRLKRKSEQENHLFDLENVKNLSTAIQYPIAVFDSTKKDGSKVILTDIKDKKGSNYVVAMRLSHKGRGRHQIEINDIKSVYPKEHYLGIIDWINSNDNLLKFADKEKVLNYISVQSTNLIGNGNIAKDSTNVHQKVEKAKQSIQDFQNPISDKEVSDIQFSLQSKTKLSAETVYKEKQILQEPIYTNETKEDEDEGTLTKVLKPKFITKWNYSDNYEPEITEFDTLKEAIDDSFEEGNMEYNKDSTPSKEVIVNYDVEWVNKDNEVIDEDGFDLTYEEVQADIPNEIKKLLELEDVGVVHIETFDSNLERERRRQGSADIRNDVQEGVAEVLKNKKDFSYQKAGMNRMSHYYTWTNEEGKKILLRIADHNFKTDNILSDKNEDADVIYSIVIQNHERRLVRDNRFEKSSKIKRTNKPDLIINQQIFDIEDIENIGTAKDFIKQIKEGISNIENGENLTDDYGIQYMQTSNGEIYGAKLPDGTIYINPNKLNANTPIHEFSHLWEQLMPNAWKRGVELLKQTKIGKDIFGKLKSEGNYPNLTDEQLWSEALNTHIGNYGEWQYHSTALQKLGQWLKNLFQKLGDFIKYKGKLSPDTKLNDFTKGVLGDLLGNNELIGEEGFNHHKGETQYSKQELRQAAKEMIGKVVSLAFNRKKGTESITVGYFNDYAKSLIEEVSGLKLKHRVSFEINESDVRHSIKEHFGKNETDSRNHPIQKEDYDKILDIASNPDRIVYIGVDGKTGLKLFSFQKEYENGDFAIVNFIGKSGGRLSFKTFYQNKKGIHQRQNADLKQSPSANAQTRSVAFPSYDANVQNLLNFETDTNKEYVDNHINNDNNDIRFQIIGKQGAENLDQFDTDTNRISKLQEAEEMELSSNSPKEIRIKTGWERGADGEWRYEIPDIKPFDDVVENHLTKTLEKVKTIGEWFSKQTGSKVKEGMIQLGDFAQKGSTIKQAQELGIELSPLFEAYPQLKDIKIKLHSIEESSSKGSYKTERELFFSLDNNAVRTISIREDLSPTQANATLIHEIQHAIQDIEGFAKGGNGTDVDYKRKAGEVEARNVQNRAYMSAEQRQQSTLQETEDTTRDEQIISKEAGVQMSIDDMDLYDNLMPITTLQSVASAVQENDLAKAKSILENSSWYKGLSQKDKKLVDGQSVKNVVVQQAKKRQEYKKLQTPEGIKEVFENKINQYKNAKLDTRSKIALKREAQRQAAYAIKQYVVKNRMKKKLMPGQANRLIKLATEISYPRQNLKSVYGKIEKFIATYEAIKEKNISATKQEPKTTYEESKTTYEKVNTKLEKGVNLEDFKNIDERKTAERILERERAKTAPEGEGFKIQEEAFSESENAIKNNKPKKKYVRKIIQSYTDRQFVPKLLLEASGMDNAYNRFINVQGSNGRSKEWMDKLNKKVYDGIYGKEYQMLNKIIDARATISIDQYREKEGLPPIDHHNGFNQYYAQDALNGIKEALGNKRFDELNNRASAYFAFHHEIVDKLHDNGIISEDTAKILKAREYSPRFFLEHMEDFEGNIDQQHSEIFNNSSGKLSKGAVQSLGEGSKGLKVNDTQYLMTNYVNKMSQLIAQNELNKTFAVRELPKAKQRYEVLKNQNKLSADERRFVKYFKELESKVVLNPITGVTPSGNLKYEHDAAPKGFSKNYYYDDGVRQEFFLANELHNQWNDLNKGFLGEGADKESIAKYSGSALVKNFATGNNPFFFISNTPRDFLQTALVSDQYSTFSPLGWGQVFKDALIGIRENWKHRDGKVSLMDKYIEYGGMMDFLNKQGMIKKDGYWSRNENRAINVFNIISLKQLNNYSEVMFRVGLMNRTLNNQLKAYNKEHNTNYKSVEELDQQTKDDMYYRAVREARSVLDFNQGGTITKDLEAFTPYINAATQGSRVIATAFRKNPGETTLKMLQTGTLLSGATYAMSMLLISALKGDDDEDKSTTEIYLETLNGVNEIVRRSNFIIPLGIKDEEGNWKYITIAKSQEMQPLFTLVDRVMENIARESVGQKTLDWKFITNEVRLSFDNALPINPIHNPFNNESQVIDLAAKNPLIKGAIAIGYGINPFTKQPVSSDVGKVSISQEGMNDSRIEGFYKTLFPMIGMSPARTKTFVEGIITQPTTNPFISFIYAGADLMTGNSDSDKLMNNLYKAATKRVLRETSEFNYKMNLDKEHKRELESMKESADKNNAELKSIVKYAIDNNLESYEAYDYFESKIEQMNLSETEKKAYYKKAKDNFKQRNTNYTTDKYDSMLYSIRNESDPEVKAKMIKVYFGDDIPEEVRERGKQLGNIFTKRVNKILEEDD